MASSRLPASQTSQLTGYYSTSVVPRAQDDGLSPVSNPTIGYHENLTLCAKNNEDKEKTAAPKPRDKPSKRQLKCPSPLARSTLPHLYPLLCVGPRLRIEPVPDLHLRDERPVRVLGLGALVLRAGGSPYREQPVEQGIPHDLRPVPLISQVPGVFARLGAQYGKRPSRKRIPPRRYLRRGPIRHGPRQWVRNCHKRLSRRCIKRDPHRKLVAHALLEEVDVRHVFQDEARGGAGHCGAEDAEEAREEDDGEEVAVEDATCLDLFGEGVGGRRECDDAEEPGVECELREELEGWGLSVLCSVAGWSV